MTAEIEERERNTIDRRIKEAHLPRMGGFGCPGIARHVNHDLSGILDGLHCGGPNHAFQRHGGILASSGSWNRLWYAIYSELIDEIVIH